MKKKNVISTISSRMKQAMEVVVSGDVRGVYSTIELIIGVYETSDGFEISIKGTERPGYGHRYYLYDSKIRKDNGAHINQILTIFMDYYNAHDEYPNTEIATKELQAQLDKINNSLEPYWRTSDKKYTAILFNGKIKAIIYNDIDLYDI